MSEMEEIEVGAEKKSEVSAKSISKAFKVISGAGIIVCAVLKWLGIMPNAEIGEICMMWSVVYALGAGTIDLNIFADKFSRR